MSPQLQRDHAGPLDFTSHLPHSLIPRAAHGQGLSCWLPLLSALQGGVIGSVSSSSQWLAPCHAMVLAPTHRRIHSEGASWLLSHLPRTCPAPCVSTWLQYLTPDLPVTSNLPMEAAANSLSRQQCHSSSSQILFRVPQSFADAPMNAMLLDLSKLPASPPSIL